MKILILGYKGMLGYELTEVLENGNKLALWDRNQIDIANKEEAAEKIGSWKPDIVVNAAAYTAVDKAESEKDLAYKVNGCAVGYLAAICKEIGAIFVHFSTDYVFSGDNHLGYKENHPIEKPLNIYGKSKALGEKMIQDVNPKYYLIRTSWLFGKNGKNFVETMLRLAREGKEIKVVNDQFGCPTYAKDLAEKVKELLDSGREYGIYHIINLGSCSWYEFASEIFRQASQGGQAKLKTKIKPIKSEEFFTPVKRPTYSMLLNTKLPPLRSWQEGLKAYLVETGRIKG